MPPQTRQNPRSGNPPAVLAPVFDLVLLRVHRQNLASRKVITLRTFLCGLFFTALVPGSIPTPGDESEGRILALLNHIMFG